MLPLMNYEGGPVLMAEKMPIMMVLRRMNLKLYLNTIQND